MKETSHTALGIIQATPAAGEREAASLDWLGEAGFAELPRARGPGRGLRPERGAVRQSATERQALEGAGRRRLAADGAGCERDLQGGLYGSIRAGDLRAACLSEEITERHPYAPHGCRAHRPTANGSEARLRGTLWQRRELRSKREAETSLPISALRTRRSSS